MVGSHVSGCKGERGGKKMKLCEVKYFALACYIVKTFKIGKKYLFKINIMAIGY